MGYPTSDRKLGQAHLKMGQDRKLGCNIYIYIYIYISAGNRGNFAARLLGKIAERLIDYNRLFGSSPDTQ